MKISTCIITYNAERTIKECLESVKWTDEIIIVDSYSEDNTIEIAKNYTDKIIKKEWQGYVNQKNYALEQAKNEWVLCIDADEVITNELKEEIIKELTENKDNYDGYYIKRLTYYLNKFIYHCDWYPDYKLRLFKKNKGRWVGEIPLHERVELNGKVKYLKNNMLHYSYKDLSDHLKRMDSYSEIAAKELYKKGIKSNLCKILLNPIYRFLKMYFFKLGFLDGYEGFIISIFGSFYVFLKYVKLYELQKIKNYHL